VSLLTRVLRNVRNQTDQDQTPKRGVCPRFLDILPPDGVLNRRQALGRIVSQDSLSMMVLSPACRVTPHARTYVYQDDLLALREPTLSDDRGLGLDRADGKPAVGEDGDDTSEEALRTWS
jgi:hypothetical protein